MDRLLATASVLLTTALLAGCGGDDDTTQPAANTETTATTDSSAKVAVERTDGRTGDAVVVDGSSKRERVIGRGGKMTGKPKKGGKGEVGVGAGAACTDVELVPDDSNLPQVEASILCLVNGERADNGAGPVTPNAKLKTASLGHSKDMAANKFFAHISPAGTTLRSRVEETGYLPASDLWVLGENLAWGTGGISTPKAVVQAWMDSPGHRVNLLCPDFKEVGIGIVSGVPVDRPGGATYTTDYGTRETRADGCADGVAGEPGGGGGGKSDAAEKKVVVVTAAQKRRCARRKRVAKRVGTKVRCVRKHKRRR